VTRLNHTVDQFTPAADRYTKFDGLERINVVVTVPDWHEPFPIKVRMGAANPRQLEMVGLLHVCKTWYINGPVADQWTISTLGGAINVPAGTRIESEELPEKWAGWEKEAGVEHNVQKKWFAYSNGRTAFC
jgi:hypothetical protein